MFQLALFENALDFFIKGGIFMVLLLICSFVALTVMLLRLFALRRRAVIPADLLFLAAHLVLLVVQHDLDVIGTFRDARVHERRRLVWPAERRTDSTPSARNEPCSIA